jgi:hypothetical protein
MVHSIAAAATTACAGRWHFVSLAHFDDAVLPLARPELHAAVELRAARAPPSVGRSNGVGHVHRSGPWCTPDAGPPPVTPPPVTLPLRHCHRSGPWCTPDAGPPLVTPAAARDAAARDAGRRP